jgi:hypothetical protein
MKSTVLFVLFAIIVTATILALLLEPEQTFTPGVLYAQIKTPAGKIVQGVCTEYTYSPGVVTLIVEDTLYYAHPGNVLLIER